MDKFEVFWLKSFCRKNYLVDDLALPNYIPQGTVMSLTIFSAMVTMIAVTKKGHIEIIHDFENIYFDFR